MSDNNEHQLEKSTKQSLARIVGRTSQEPAAELLKQLHPSEVADFLESLGPEERSKVWALVESHAKGEVLVEAHEEVRAQLIRATDPSELVSAVEGLELDELADVSERLPPPVVEAVLRAMDAQRRRRYESVRAYAEDTAGGLMDVDALAVRADVTLRVVLRYLRRVRRQTGQLPEHLHNLVVIDRQSHYMGLLDLSDVVSLPRETVVAQVMEQGIKGIPATMPAGKVARLFEDRDLIAAPVVDEGGRLIGRITVDDVVDVIRHEAEHSMMSSAGLSEDLDMFAPVVPSARRRAVWLGVNLVNALIAAWVIGMFEDAIDRLVALAILMPVVASMGGVAGNQTLTLVTRGLALEQVRDDNARRLLRKELAVAMLNGTFWALVVAMVAGAWFRDIGLALVFGAALVLNLVNGAAVGTLLPLLLVRLRIDPALAGGVLVTALTDVVGFAAFLGLGAAMLV